MAGDVNVVVGISTEELADDPGCSLCSRGGLRANDYGAVSEAAASIAVVVMLSTHVGAQ